jgi:hypothetical protein
LSPPIMTKSIPRTPKPSSPVNVSHFPIEGWLSHTRPTTCAVPGRIGTIIGYEDYYIHEERVLCTRAFSVAAVATTVDDGASPPGSTELDDEAGHNCKMSHDHYKSFCRLVLGLYYDTWALHRTERAFRNLIIQDLDTIMYYWDSNIYNMDCQPMSYRGDRWDMARTLARIALLLTGAEACTPRIVASVWGEDEAACLALGGPRGDLSLIRRKLLTLSKVAMNMVHIWMNDSAMNFLAPNSPSFQRLPPTVQQLLLLAGSNKIYAREPVPSGTPATQLLTNNLCEYTYPDTLPFEEKAIRWYRELLLHPDRADDMTGFDNGILIAYGMCPPCPLQEFYQMAPENQPTHFMRGTAAEIWGTDTHEVMRTTAADWDTEDMTTAAADCWDLDD